MEQFADANTTIYKSQTYTVTILLQVFIIAPIFFVLYSLFSKELTYMVSIENLLVQTRFEKTLFAYKRDF